MVLHRRAEAKFSRTLELVASERQLLQVAQLPKLTGDGACGWGGGWSIGFCCVGLVLHRRTEAKFSRTSQLVVAQNQALQVAELPKLTGDGTCGQDGWWSIGFCCVGLLQHKRREAKFSRTLELVVVQGERLQVAELPKLTGDGACGWGG